MINNNFLFWRIYKSTTQTIIKNKVKYVKCKKEDVIVKSVIVIFICWQKKLLTV